MINDNDLDTRLEKQWHLDIDNPWAMRPNDFMGKVRTDIK